MARVEFECRNCKRIVSAEQYKTDAFCLTCGTRLNLKPQPKHWLFQFNPSLYRWFDRIKETQEPEQWLISQNAKLIQKGDSLAIWSSGQKAGVYALGQIITRPAKNPLNLNQQKYFLHASDVGRFQEKHSAYVRYSCIFVDRPLLQEDCNKDKTLMNLQVLIYPQGTNFRLRIEQWDRILELLGETEKASRI